MQPVLLTKLFPPRIGKRIVERPRLIGLLSEAATKKLTFLNAPAGYGKTVLALQLVRHFQRPFVWYQLDSGDNDLAGFLHTLLLGIRQQLPEFGGETMQILGEGNLLSRLRLLTATFINDLLAHPQAGFVLVFDDLHAIQEASVHEWIRDLILGLPPDYQVIATSRLTPPPAYSRLRISGDILHVEADKLCFTSGEISVLLSHNGLACSPQQAHTLKEKTAGWPAALSLLSDVGVEEKVFGLGSGQLYDYLATEILAQQPETVRSFLLETAVLDEFTTDFCDQFLGRSDAQNVLDTLERQQLFLMVLSGETKSYRYHQLFRDFLLHQLGSSRRPALLQRASRLAQEKGQFDQAVAYLINANLIEELIPVLTGISGEALRLGRWQTVSRWLDNVPEERIRREPWLCLFKAWIEIYRGRIDFAAEWQETACDLCQRCSLPLALLECDIVRAKILRSRGQYQQSLELLEKVESQLPTAAKEQRLDLALEKVVLYILTGRFHAAASFLKETLAAARRQGNPYIVSHLLEGLGNIYYLLGEYPKALRMYKQSAEVSPDHALPGYYMQDSISTIYQDWGHLDKALEYAQRNAAIKENLGLTEDLPSAYIQLASIYVDRGEFERGEEYYQRAIRMIREHGGERFYLALNLAFHAACLSLQGKWVEAQSQAEEALAEAENQSGLALAVCRAVTAPIFIRIGHPEVEKWLKYAALSLENAGFKKALASCYTVMAWFESVRRKPAVAEEMLEKALAISAAGGFIQGLVTYYPLIQSFLGMALKKRLEVTFVQKILVNCGERALPLLRRLAEDSDPAVRQRVLTPLAEIGGAETAALLEKLSRDPDPGVRNAVCLLTMPLREVGAPGTLRAELPEKREAAPPLRLALLGPFRIFLNGSDISADNWRATKARDLLAYLAHQVEPVTTDRILEDLWPDMDPQKALVNFHTTVYRLRRKLGRSAGTAYILHGSRRYQLNSDSYQTDKQRFEGLTAFGMKGTFTPHKIVALEEAVSLYRGDYLCDIDYEWVIPLQEHINQVYVEVRLTLAKHYLEQGEYSRAVLHLREILAVNPLLEDVHCLLMKAYAGQGDRIAVREQFRQLESLLDAELNLKPSPKAAQLLKTLLN